MKSRKDEHRSRLPQDAVTAAFEQDAQLLAADLFSSEHRRAGLTTNARVCRHGEQPV
ncbi:hypothetical protein ABZM97_13635 [Bacillus vallismortis]|uniref:Uncharacterized protein n=1 Tax=Bacillus vallismortis TaxID=72361 RepID=A0ABY4XV32_BACVA|nr:MULTISPECIES: hypothetical protein [Bacillus]MBL3646348.1 hypothetical protein [Bacillus sp. RHFS10]USP94220.1 hypothetical protein MKF32_13245 [Bacillus vallismortis]